MRIGIWCDYGFTLEPSEGIGVFVDCLARGLVRADDKCQLLLAPHPGQSSALDSTVAAGRGRIVVAERLRPSRLRRRVLRTLSKCGARPCATLTKTSTGDTLPLHGATSGPRLERTQFFSSVFLRGLNQVATVLAKPFAEDTARLIDSCDVWLLPYVGCDQHFTKPTVVVVHDLVCYHFSDVMKPAKLRRFQQQVEQQTAAAAVVACMSQFIKANDLCGLLRLPTNRVQVIRSAVPDHLPTRPASDSALTAAEQLPQMKFSEPFLLYPSAFRTYKNHRYLIELIPHLKASRLWPMKIVFTGIRHCPRWLKAVIDDHAAQDDIVMLGKVTREQLANLYRRAFATVVPSLYEQGSFPLLEALHHGCPALAADIPSLREQFDEMGEAMPFFDPHVAGSVIGWLEHIAEHRESFIGSQQSSFERLRSRTWTHAAGDWLELFHTIVDEKSSLDDRAAPAA